ncbi:MAG: hypothetical protein JNL52_03655 [Flavobacteriales bacterium]|nr:hypothetical protein [Flavobacteriales bacterium]
MSTTGLTRDWLMAPAFDLELKHYVLLAYLQRVQQRFKEHKLYPHLDELRDQISELCNFRLHRKELAMRLGGSIIGFDPFTGAALREPPPEPEALGTVDAVIDLALPRLSRALDRGVDLREELAARIQFGPIGLLPLYRQEGWLLLRTGRLVRVYSYALSGVHAPTERQAYSMLQTHYVSSHTLSIACTYEAIRSTLIQHHRERPVPATYAFEADVPIPHIETFMPLAKQLIYKAIASDAGSVR